MPWTTASLLVRLCRKGDLEDFELMTNGSTVIDGLPNSGIEGDCIACPLYGGRVPLTRSGDNGNRGVPGEAGNLKDSIVGVSLIRSMNCTKKAFFRETNVD